MSLRPGSSRARPRINILPGYRRAISGLGLRLLRRRRSRRFFLWRAVELASTVADDRMNARPRRRRARLVRGIVVAARRALKPGVLLDRQRAMEDIAFDARSAVEPHPIGADRALDPPADRQLLGHHIALDLGALSDQHRRRMQLAFDAAENFHAAGAGDLADHRHAGTDR